MENIKLKENFSQVCVWPGTIVSENKIDEFEKFFLNELDTRIQYLEEIKTNPSPNEPNSGGRNDILFAVHEDDIIKFSIKRLSYGMRWIEDVYGNNQGHLYPDRVTNYKTW